MNLAVVAIAGVLFFMILGIKHPRFKQPAIRKDLNTDILHALVNGLLLDILIAFCLAKITYALHQTIGFGYLGFLKHKSLWLQAIIFIIAGDLVKWTLHVLQHKIPFLWRFHRLHHCTQQMDTLSYARTHPVEVLINRIPFLTIFVVIAGIDIRIIIAYSAVDLLQGLWIHSNTHIRLGWLNYIFSTQEFHHWHHANQALAIDKNFGGFLSIWDWILGTAYCPKSENVERLGISEINPPPVRYIDHLFLPFVNYSSDSIKTEDQKELQSGDVPLEYFQQWSKNEPKFTINQEHHILKQEVS